MRARIGARVLAAAMAALLAIPAVPAGPALAVGTTTTVESSLNPSTYGQEVTFTATVTPADATGQVTFTDGTTTLGTGALDGGGVAIFATDALGGGDHSITATYDGDGTYDPSTSGAITQHVDRAAQTIAFTSAAPTNAKVGGATYTPTAIATSGRPVSFSIPTPRNVCTIDAGTVSFKGTGTCTIHADEGGDANWLAAPQATQAFQVTGPTTTTTAVSSSANPSQYGQAVTFTATITPVDATGAVQFVVDGADFGSPVTVVSGTAASGSTSALAVGTHTVAADYTTDDPVTYGSSGGTLAGGQGVTKADQVITFGPLADRTYGDAAFGVSATASSGLAVSFSSLTTGVCTVAGSTVTIVGAGACTIRASQAGNANYNAAAPVDQPFTVAKATQAITFAQPPDRAFNESPITVAATASSSLPVSFSSLTTGVCTTGGTNGTSVTFVTTGTCTIQATQAGNANYNAATPVNRSFAIGAASQTITFGTLADRAIDESPFTVSATASSGLTVTFSSLTTGVCATGGTNGAAVTLLATGTCTIRASQAGDASYDAAPDVDRSFTVGKASQTIAFAQPPDRTYGDAPFGVTATASSGLSVSFSSLTTAVCTVAGSTVTIVGAGTCTIRATQPGDDEFSAAPDVDRSVAVAKANQTITFGTLGGMTYGDPPFDVAASATSGLPVSFSSLTTAVCTVAADTVTIVGGGTCTIRASQAGNTNYNAAPDVDRSFTVAKATQTITFGTLADRAFDESPISVAATASSRLPVAFSSLTTGVCTVAGTSVTFVTVGTCTIRASQAGDTDYSAAPNVDRSFAITKADQAITFGPLADRTYGDAAFGVSATASSGLAVSFSSLTTGVCTVAGSTVTIVGAGACTIRASQAGNANYNAAAPVDQSFTVAKATQAITFAQPPDRAFNESPITVAATASSSLPVSFSSLTTGVCTTGGTNGTSVTFVTTGTCTIQATQAGNANYNAATPVNRSFAIGAASQTITFGTLAGKTYGDAPFAVTATASSGLPVAFSSLTTGVCTVAGSTVTIVAAGSCTIRASQAGDASYDAALDVDRTFAVAKAAQTTTFGTLAGKTYGDAPFAVMATASSGLPVAFSSQTTGVCTVAGSTVTIVAAGTCTIRASQAGDANYNAALNVDRTFAVAKKAAVVTANDASRAYGAANPVFTATITGLVGTDNPGTPACALREPAATPSSPVDTYPIDCTQGSLSTTSYTYTYVAGTLSVTPATLTVRADDVLRQYGLPNPTTFTFTYSGLVAGDDPADIDVAPTCALREPAATPSSPVGTYPIDCTGGGDANYTVAPVDGTLTIEPARPEPDVSADVNPAAVTEPVEFTASVSWPIGTPAGTVRFFVDGSPVTGAIDLVGGEASYSTSSLALGDHAVTVVYTPAAGVTNFATATSQAFTQSIGTTPVDIDLTSNRSNWETNVPITFTATMKPRASRVTAPVTGQVVFAVDGVDRATVDIAGGLAAYASPPLSSGAHAVTARYLRDTPAEARFTVGNPGALAKIVVANTVSASGVGTSSSSVYPVKDTWKDAVAIRGTRNEAASVSIKIYRVVAGKDPLVKTVSLARNSGSYAYNWKGRRSGRILPAGKYKVVQLLTDAFGAKKKYVSYVTLSTKKMTWYTKKITVSPGPRNYQVGSTANTDWEKGPSLSAASSRNSGAVVMDNRYLDSQGKPVKAWLAAGYQFRLPSASTYTSVSFQVAGSWTGTTGPKFGLVPWSSGDWFKAMYSTTRARATMDTIATDWDPHTLTNLAGVRSGRYVRAVIDSFAGPSGWSTGPYRYSITGVRLVVKYGILR